MKLRPEVTIENLATSVYDNGRRGSPKPGCDCVQCFGYCLIDREKAARDVFAIADRQEKDIGSLTYRDDASDAPIAFRGLK